MKSSFVIVLLLCAMAVCQIREYVYIPEGMTWPSAQKYCRENYVDLATITNAKENQILPKAAAALTSSYAWIGLNRTTPGIDIWEWSDGETPNFMQWRTDQPDNWLGLENCVLFGEQGWNDANCQKAYPFYCYWRFVLVKDNKTWDEALHYCRTYYTGLATPITLAQLVLSENATIQTQTVSVWNGLRFVNGQWVCVNRVPLQGLVSLPSCPGPRYYCGAFNNKTRIWENRDCYEKLNFICY